MHFRACAFAGRHLRRFLDHWRHRCRRLRSTCHLSPIVVGVATTGTRWIVFVLHRSVYAMTPITVCALSGMQLAGRHLIRFTCNWTHFHCSRSPIGASTVDDVDASSFDKFKCTETTQGWIPTIGHHIVDLSADMAECKDNTAQCLQYVERENDYCLAAPPCAIKL